MRPLAPSFGSSSSMPASATEAFGFQHGAEIPVIEGRIHFAAERLGRQQRRRAVDDRRLRLEVDAVLSRPRLQQQPVLVDRAAGDGELAAPEIGQCPDRGCGRHHHGAERARIRIEGQSGAKPAFARYPQPVGDDDIGAAGAKRDLACLGAREFENLNREVCLLVEAMGADHRQFPGEGSALLHCNAHGLRAPAGAELSDGQDNCRHQHAKEKLSLCPSRLLATFSFQPASHNIASAFSSGGRR